MNFTHRELCQKAASWLLDQASIDLVNYELKVYSGFADAIGVDSSGKDKRISIIEVKRSRADLLQDLRAKKMLKYQKTASHCYLAITLDCFPSKTDKQILEELLQLGLPDKWGVLVWRNNGYESIHSARRIREPTPAECNRLSIRIAKSYMYRELYTR